MPRSNSEIEQSMALARQATPGPWVVDTGDDEYCSSISGVISVAEQQRIAEISRIRLHRGDFPEETLWVTVDPGCAPVKLSEAHTPYNDSDFIADAGTNYLTDMQDLLALRKEVERLGEAMPTIDHPGGRLVMVKAFYADGSTQSIDGRVIEEALSTPESNTNG